MVEAIKGIFPEVINKNIENIDKTVLILNDVI